ncbi:hypothetical protein [Selenomonas ruminantium]|uniref:hypothetical protein n=1 Tax=Selenomonas ruminantium TaxID=971 RepID=UPI0005A55D09|nr:hypothetical protein [Selenomonas ruminantium]
MLIEIKPLYNEESMHTANSRLSCENRLNAIILKYNISAIDASIVAEGVEKYVNSVVKDCKIN